MTIRDLIDAFEDLATDHGDDTPVHLAQQPRWPLEFTLARAVAVEDDDDEDRPAVVYLVEGEPLGYLNGEATRAAWSE